MIRPTLNHIAEYFPNAIIVKMKYRNHKLSGVISDIDKDGNRNMIKVESEIIDCKLVVKFNETKIQKGVISE